MRQQERRMRLILIPSEKQSILLQFLLPISTAINYTASETKPQQEQPTTLAATKKKTIEFGENELSASPLFSKHFHHQAFANDSHALVISKREGMRKRRRITIEYKKSPANVRLCLISKIQVKCVA